MVRVVKSGKVGIRKKPKLYMGKPVKKKVLNKQGNFVPYVPKRKREDPLKVQFHEWCDMSNDAYKRIPARWRRKCNKRVFRPVFIFPNDPKPTLAMIPPENLSTTQLIGETAINLIGYPGSFQLRMFVHRKNKFHCSPCKRAKIVITEHPEGLRAKVTEYHFMSRYWFFKEK